MLKPMNKAAVAATLMTFLVLLGISGPNLFAKGNKDKSVGAGPDVLNQNPGPQIRESTPAPYGPTGAYVPGSNIDSYPGSSPYSKVFTQTDDWGLEVKAISAHSVAISWNPGRLLTGQYEIQVLDKQLRESWKTLADVTKGSTLTRLDNDVVSIPSAEAPIILHQNLEAASPYLYRIISVGTSRSASSPVVATSTQAGVADGVYVGIISFAGTVEPVSRGLVHLDGSGKQRLMDSLDTLHTLPDSGSALYYAVHQALTDIDLAQWESRLPDVIDSTTLITFTDGLDTGSTNTAYLPPLRKDPEDGIWSAVREFMNPGLSADVNRTSIREYSRYIRDRLRTPSTHAFSIGIHGKDAVDLRAFEETVQTLISPSGGAYLLDNYRQLETQLARIVDSQIKVLSRPRYTFSMFTPVYPNDTKIRITFDGKSAMASTKFIDARLLRTDTAADLVEVVGRNVAIADLLEDFSSPPIEGYPEGKTEFRFTLTLNEAISAGKVQQWYIQQTGGVQTWARNSETDRIVVENHHFEYQDDHKTNVVYLVLDASASTAGEMTKIRLAAKQYIEKLYLEIAGISTKTAGSPSSSFSASSPGSGTAGSYGSTDNANIGSAWTPTAYGITNYGVMNFGVADYGVTGKAWWVQAGAYRNAANAAEAHALLQSRGYGARISETGTLKLVQVGPFATRQQAERALGGVRSIPGWFSDSFVKFD